MRRRHTERSRGHSDEVTPAELRQRYEFEATTAHRYDSADFWDRRYHRTRFTTIANRLRPLLRTATSFIDVGCGSGEYLVLARQSGVGLVCGVDLSFAYARRARQIAGGSVTAHASADSLPFLSSSFDVVLCSEVIEHVEPSSSTCLLNELTRIAKRTIVITTPNDRAAIRLLARRLVPEKVRQLDDQVGHINLFGYDDLREAVSSLDGWTLQSYDSTHVLPPVVGDGLSIPSWTASLMTRLERLASHLGPKSGNMMFVVLEREFGRPTIR